MPNENLEAFGATDGSKEGDRQVFGIDSSIWTVAAKKRGGVPWHQGVIRGAERLWPPGARKKRRRAKTGRPGDRRDDHEQDTPETTTGGEQRLVTAAEECKNEMSDRIARYAPVRT